MAANPAHPPLQRIAQSGLFDDAPSTPGNSRQRSSIGDRHQACWAGIVRRIEEGKGGGGGGGGLGGFSLHNCLQGRQLLAFLARSASVVWPRPRRRDASHNCQMALGVSKRISGWLSRRPDVPPTDRTAPGASIGTVLKNSNASETARSVPALHCQSQLLRRTEWPCRAGRAMWSAQRKWILCG